MERKHRKPEHCARPAWQWVSFCGHVSTSSYQNVKCTSKGHDWHLRAVQNVCEVAPSLPRPWCQSVTVLPRSRHLHRSAAAARPRPAGSTPSRLPPLPAELSQITSFSLFLFFPFFKVFDIKYKKC